MRILLIAPIKDSYSGLAQYPPVGLGYLATSVRKSGHSVRILDCVKEQMDFLKFEYFIKNNNFDVIGITVWSLSLREVKNSLEIIKRNNPKAITVIGGPHPSALPEDSLRFFREVDFGFKGEAEIGFARFIDLLNHGGCNFQDIPGLIWRSRDKVISNAPIWADNLDELGFPSWDLINPRDYFMPGALVSKDTAVLTCTRGCPYQCTFCSAWITAGRKIRCRSIKHILSEIEYLSSNFGIRIFDIPDENFTFDKKYVMDFCEAVMQYNGKFEFFLPNGIRLDSLNRELLITMRKAGFRREVAVGIESGSERVLKLMKKNLSLDKVKEKIKLLNQAGFRPIGYFIVGFPGESREDLRKTLRLALNLKLYAAAFTPFAPMPGTEATDYILKNKELPEDFDFTSITTDKVAYAPVGMTKQELNKFRKYALLRFNLRPRPLFYYLSNYNSFRFAFVKFLNLFFKNGQVDS
ncbi:MAG: radical SAM protein [Candidatus Omnitrophota bacterium]|nr:radical SAM protein [Candidatus Omnitrophota bacterium]